MTTQTASLSGRVREFTAKQVFLAGLRGGAWAAVANLALYFVALAAGIPMVGKFDPNLPASVLQAPFPVIASLVPALVGAGVLLGMNAVLSRPSKWFVPAAGLVTVLSMGGPLSVGEASPATKGVLMAMHVVAAFFITRSLVKHDKV